MAGGASSPLGCCLVFLLVAAGAAPALADWTVQPELRAGGGTESDLVLDPAVTRTVVPGGAFAEIAPGVAGRRWLSSGGFLDLGTTATLQRFFNDESRLLYAQSVFGDLHTALGGPLRTRVSASLSYFDDSERETVRRLGGGLEAGLLYGARRWTAEVWGGGRGRTYPRLDVLEADSVTTSTYAEGTWIGGANVRASLGDHLVLRAEGSLQGTQANDATYDALAWTTSGNADVRVARSWILTAFLTAQRRHFTERLESADHDHYWQIGLGVRKELAPGWTASLRYGFATYTWPDESQQDTHHLAIGLQRIWGRDRALPPLTPPVVEPASSGSVRRRDAQGRVRLRLEAGDANQVSVVGTFNAWNPESTPLRRGEAEWWQVELDLAPGIYEYAYVVDGVWVTPPEADITVDDGFGGKNGLIEVIPPGP
jgi:hypothetical protein